MATVNKRARIAQACTINGISAGGLTVARVVTGEDVVLRSSPDGIGGPPIEDLITQFCRGSIATQDWIHMIELLTGVVGTHVFYERKAGVAAATGHLKHTINNPVIHTARLTTSKDGYAVVGADFECKAADETKGYADMFTTEDAQAAPTYVPAARGGYRAVSATFDPDGAATPISIYHVMSMDFLLALVLDMDCNDSDVGYTQVDLIEDGMRAEGSLSFQDTEVVGGQIKSQSLLSAGRGTLAVRYRQGSGATDKTVTINGVRFRQQTKNSGSGKTDHTLGLYVTNNAETPLTLTGTNKIITIADAA